MITAQNVTRYSQVVHTRRSQLSTEHKGTKLVEFQTSIATLALKLAIAIGHDRDFERIIIKLKYLRAIAISIGTRAAAQHIQRQQDGRIEIENASHCIRKRTTFEGYCSLVLL